MYGLTLLWLNKEQRDSVNQMHLFQVLRRQRIDIINIISVVPMSLLLTLNSWCSQLVHGISCSI